jgi:hypothetical protein
MLGGLGLTLFSPAAGGTFNGQSLGIAVNSVMRSFAGLSCFQENYPVFKRGLTAAFKYFPEVTLVILPH